MFSDARGIHCAAARCGCRYFPSTKSATSRKISFANRPRRDGEPDQYSRWIFNGLLKERFSRICLLQQTFANMREIMLAVTRQLNNPRCDNFAIRSCCLWIFRASHASSKATDRARVVSGPNTNSSLFRKGVIDVIRHCLSSWLGGSTIASLLPMPDRSTVGSAGKSAPLRSV